MRLAPIALCCGLLATASAARGSDGPSPEVAATAEGASAAPGALTLKLHRFRLDNGLRVVISENHNAPTVAVCVTYDVGSRNEQEGRSGFAHLFEHMMFQGTRNVPKGDHFRLIAGRGGYANGTTTSERTNYFETLPASELELALWLESERMGYLAVTPENFENQRKVVQEEYRMSVSNRAYGLGPTRLIQLVFQGYWPYEHSTIGKMEDLDGADFEWVLDFYRHHYGPNNAVLTIAGDVDPKATRELVDKHFGKLKGRVVPPYDAPQELPRQTSERLSVMTDVNAKTPGVFYGWPIPPLGDKDHYALDLAALVLTRGESSRLYQSLVNQRAAALNVIAATGDMRGPDIFLIHVQTTPLSSIDKAQEALEGELKRMSFIGPSKHELEKAKSQLRFQFLRSLESNQGVAISLGEYETYWGDASKLFEELGKYDAVTIADIRRAATTYLVDTKRSIVEMYPPGWVKDEPPEIIQRSHVVQKGDTLTHIAVRYGSTVHDICAANNINAKSTLIPGRKLIVPVTGIPAKGSSSKARAPRPPPMRTHKVKKGENLSVIAHRYKTTVKAIVAANGLNVKKPLQLGQELKIPAATSKGRAPRRTTKRAEKKQTQKKSRSTSKKSTTRKKSTKGSTKSSKPANQPSSSKSKSSTKGK